MLAPKIKKTVGWTERFPGKPGITQMKSKVSTPCFKKPLRFIQSTNKALMRYQALALELSSICENGLDLHLYMRPVYDDKRDFMLVSSCRKSGTYRTTREQKRMIANEKTCKKLARFD